MNAESLEVPMSRVRSLLMVTAVVALAGCYSYQLVPLASVEPKNDVRLTTRDGHREELGDVTVASDSVRGRSIGQRWFWTRRRSVALAVADLTKVEVRRLDVARSVRAGVAVAVLAGGAAWLVATNWDDWWSWSPLGW